MSSISNNLINLPVHEDVYRDIYKYVHGRTQPAITEINYNDKVSIEVAQKINNFIRFIINELSNPSREDHNNLRKKVSILDYFAETINTTPFRMEIWMMWVTDEALHHHLKVQYKIQYVRRPKGGFTEGCTFSVSRILPKDEETKENPSELK